MPEPDPDWPTHGVIHEVPPGFLEWRRSTGIDRFDEMWEGVLHVNPAPNLGHQELRSEVEAWLRLHWAARAEGRRVHSEINVSDRDDWTNDYRIPDITLVTPERRCSERHAYFHGAPEVVIEIRSPGDDSWKKLPFYARLGVPEAWIIDGDTKEPIVLRLHIASGEYQRENVDTAGFVTSAATGILMRATEGKLEILFAGDAATRSLLPPA